MGFFIAFIGGILTFISPCILPLVPIYIAYITGISAQELKENKSQNRKIFFNSLLFVLGFTVVFIVLAILLFIFSISLGSMRIWLSRIGGLIIVIFGLHLTGIFNLKFLNFQLKPQIEKKESSFFTSFLMGIAFGSGWTPCVGPILSGILLLSTQSSKLLISILQLITYSIGIGIPFIITGIFLNRMLFLINFFKMHAKKIEIISGVFLIILGITVSFNLMGIFANFFAKVFSFLLNIENILLN